MCPRYGKVVKSISSLIRYINTYKIPIALSFYLFLKPKQILKYTKISNLLDVLSNNNEKNLKLANINK